MTRTHVPTGLRRAIGGFSVLAGARGLSIVLQAVALGLQARGFGVSGFAVHAIVASACYLAMTLFDLGLGTRALRLAAEPDPAIARGLARLRLLTLVAIAPAAVITAAVLNSKAHVLLIAVTTALFVAGETAGEMAMSVWLGERSRTLAASVLVARRAMGLLPFAVLGATTSGAAASLAATGLAGLGACLVIACRRAGDGSSLKELARTALPYWSASVSSGVGRLDVLIVGAIGGQQLAGLFGAANRLSNPLNTATSLILQIAVPEMSSAADFERKHQAFRVLSVIMWIQVLALSILALFAEPLTRLLLGEEFVEGSAITAAVIVAVGISSLMQVRYAWFMATEMPDGILTRSIAGALIGLAGFAVLTWLYGLNGTAMAIIFFSLAVLAAVGTSRPPRAKPRLAP